MPPKLDQPDSSALIGEVEDSPNPAQSPTCDTRTDYFASSSFNSPLGASRAAVPSTRGGLVQQSHRNQSQCSPQPGDSRLVRDRYRPNYAGGHDYHKDQHMTQPADYNPSSNSSLPVKDYRPKSPDDVWRVPTWGYRATPNIITQKDAYGPRYVVDPALAKYKICYPPKDDSKYAFAWIHDQAVKHSEAKFRQVQYDMDVKMLCQELIKPHPKLQAQAIVARNNPDSGNQSRSQKCNSRGSTDSRSVQHPVLNQSRATRFKRPDTYWALSEKELQSEAYIRRLDALYRNKAYLAQILVVDDEEFNEQYMWYDKIRHLHSKVLYDEAVDLGIFIDSNITHSQETLLLLISEKLARKTVHKYNEQLMDKEAAGGKDEIERAKREEALEQVQRTRGPDDQMRKRKNSDSGQEEDAGNSRKKRKASRCVKDAARKVGHRKVVTGVDNNSHNSGYYSSSFAHPRQDCDASVPLNRVRNDGSSDQSVKAELKSVDSKTSLNRSTDVCYSARLRGEPAKAIGKHMGTKSAYKDEISGVNGKKSKTTYSKDLLSLEFIPLRPRSTSPGAKSKASSDEKLSSAKGRKPNKKRNGKDEKSDGKYYEEEDEYQYRDRRSRKKLPPNPYIRGGH